MADWPVPAWSLVAGRRRWKQRTDLSIEGTDSSTYAPGMATSSIEASSTLTHLQCAACGREHDAGRLQNLCPECGKVLFARYDLERAARTLTRETVAARPRGKHRYRSPSKSASARPPARK